LNGLDVGGYDGIQEGISAVIMRKAIEAGFLIQYMEL
jgi:hypothetical protein